MIFRLILEDIVPFVNPIIVLFLRFETFHWEKQTNTKVEEICVWKKILFSTLWINVDHHVMWAYRVQKEAGMDLWGKPPLADETVYWKRVQEKKGTERVKFNTLPDALSGWKATRAHELLIYAKGGNSKWLTLTPLIQCQRSWKAWKKEKSDHIVVQESGNKTVPQHKLPQIALFFYAEASLQFQLTHSFLFLALKENGGRWGNPGISLGGPHFP